MRGALELWVSGERGTQSPDPLRKALHPGAPALCGYGTPLLGLGSPHPDKSRLLRGR